MTSTDYIILNPSPLHMRGRLVTVLTYRDGKVGYVTERDYLDAEARGLIHIAEIGGNELADMFGRIRISYTIKD